MTTEISNAYEYIPPHSNGQESYYQEYKGHTKWLSFISSHFAKTNFFLARHFFMHMLIISVLYVQSIRQLQKKLRYKLISSCLHYLSTSITPI